MGLQGICDAGRVFEVIGPGGKSFCCAVLSRCLQKRAVDGEIILYRVFQGLAILDIRAVQPEKISRIKSNITFFQQDDGE